MGTPNTAGEDPFYRGFGMYWRPNQSFIYISSRFYLHWGNIIAGHEVLAVDPNGNSTKLKVGFHEGKAAFTNGVHDLVAFYSLDERTLVNFEYIQPLTFNIRIFAYHGPEIEYPTNENGPEVIILDSDCESEAAEVHDIPTETNIQWEKVVTDNYVRGRAPLNLPAEVVKKLRVQGMSSLHVRVLNTDLAADCQIRPAKRNKNEAHLIMGWYRLCKELNMSTGNKLLFTFLPIELQLLMRVVRNN